MHQRPLFWQLFPSIVSLIVLSFSAIFIYSYRPINQYLISRTKADLYDRLELVRGAVEPSLAKEDFQSLSEQLKKMTAKSGTRITLVGLDGTVLFDSQVEAQKMENHSMRPEILRAIEIGHGESIRNSMTLNSEMVYSAAKIKLADSKEGVLRLARPMNELRVQFRKVYLKVAIGGLVLLLAVAIISYFLSRRVSRPMEHMKSLAERISRGDFTARVHLKPSDTYEAHKLGQAMNDIAVQMDHRIETILNQKNERDAILGSMIEGVLAVDPNERIVHLNRAAAQILRISQTEAVGRRIQEAIRIPEIQLLIQAALQKDFPEEKDVEFLVGDQIKTLSFQSSPLKSAANKNLGAVFVFGDITTLRKLERHRTDFVANVSHELRTPLTSIRGFAETLLNPGVSEEERKKFTEIIFRHANRLGEIIEDLLALSRIEKDNESNEIELREHAVWPSLKAAIEMCEIKARKMGVSLEILGDRKLKANINPPLLEQAVINLIDNAVKYSGDGKVVKVGLAEEGDNIKISVVDQGPGIAKEHLPRLFERFYRIDKARSRQLGGTGLGLSIVKHVALAHKGEVNVESRIGEGSVFYINLPKGRLLIKS